MASVARAAREHRLRAALLGAAVRVVQEEFGDEEVEDFDQRSAVEVPETWGTRGVWEPLVQLSMAKGGAVAVASPQSSVVFGQWLPLPEVPGAALREVQVELGGDAKEFTSQGQGIEAWAQQVFRSDWVSLEQAAFVNVETERDVAQVGGADLEGKGQEGQADKLGVV